VPTAESKKDKRFAQGALEVFLQNLFHPLSCFGVAHRGVRD
jgi:hypothetical protein